MVSRRLDPASPAWHRETNADRGPAQMTLSSIHVRSFEQYPQFICGLRSTEVVALNLRASLLAEFVQLLNRLNALGRRSHAQAFAKSGDGADDRHRFLIVHQVMHEGLVDLDLVEWKAPQVSQRRV